MSYLQIYQEKIYDLLNSTNKAELSLREHPVKGMHLFAAGMSKYFFVLGILCPRCCICAACSVLCPPSVCVLCGFRAVRSVTRVAC